MKKLINLIFFLGCTTAFSQAMSSPSYSLEYREYADNAESINYKQPSVVINPNAPAVEQDFEKFWNQQGSSDYSNLSIAFIKENLDDKIAKSDSVLLKPDQSKNQGKIEDKIKLTKSK